MSATKTTIVAVLVLLVVFAGGFMAGFALHGMLPPHGRQVAQFAVPMMVRHLDRRLDLTDEQRDRVEEILTRRHERIESIRDGLRPRIHTELMAANEEISRVLTPEQRAEFEKMKMRLGPRHFGRK